MIQIDLDRIVPTSSDLRLGVVIRYGQDGPVRFAQVRIGDEHLDWQTTADLIAWLTERVNRHLDSERSLEDDLTLPGL